MNPSIVVNRRTFQAAVGSAVLGGSVVLQLQRGQAADSKTGDAGACRFAASFMTWDVPFRPDPRPYARHNIPHGNLARIELEALIDVIDRESGQAERFVLIAPCRAEWVYAEDKLFQIPSREYRNIYSQTEERAMEQRLTDTGETSVGHPWKDTFTSLTIDIKTYRRSRLLKTHAEIVQATQQNIPIVARTRIDDPNGKWRYMLEYPVRTMNFQPKSDSFQVDTGPLLVPDFQSPTEKPIDRLEMAHVVYNRLDRAEFLLRRPTPIPDADGQPLCQVLHFSEMREDRAVNEILACEES